MTETYSIHIAFIKLIPQIYSKLLEVIHKMTVIHRKPARDHCGILCFPEMATTLFSVPRLLLEFFYSQRRVKLCDRCLYNRDAPSVFICSLHLGLFFPLSPSFPPFSPCPSLPPSSWDAFLGIQPFAAR